MHNHEKKVTFPVENEESEHLIKNFESGLSDDVSIRLPSPSIQRKWRRLSPWIIHTTFELTLILLLWRQWKLGSNINCVNKHASWSPVNSLINDNYETWRFNGTFDQSSPYKGPPSPAVEDSWANLWQTGAISITEDEFRKLSASPHSVKVPEELGGGRMALLEVTHQIHCLHMLWKHTYPDYYSEDYNFSLAEPKQWHEHIDHCTDVLRQKLMCDADGSIITYNWVKGHYMPHPNFNVEHKCRNFDDVIAYAHDRQINSSKIGQDYFTRPAEYVEFDEPPHFPDEEGDHFPRSP